MKIATLDLLAFGPFRNARLDFSVKPGALQLIYGGNEAGKSTTLRAITQLLYGIPHRTVDAHLHEQTKLRIGATLVGEDGTRLRVVRRKGKSQTLLDAQGEPVDETVLTELLGGTSEALFRSMFGLDHEQLRAGAEALLAGEGDLGEGLFDAGVGGAPVHRVLAELASEAEQVYKAKGQTPKLNAALRRAKELARERREAALAPEKWQAQREALDQARERQKDLGERQAALAEEDARLARAILVLPKLAKLDALAEERKALGEVAALDADATPRRLEAERALDASERELAQLERDRSALEGERKALGEPPAEPLGDRVMVSLREAYGSFRKAEQDLPAREGELRALCDNIDGLRARLPEGVVGRDDDGYRVPENLQARLDELTGAASTLDTEARHLEREQTARREEVEQYGARLAALPPAIDVHPLARLLTDARAEPQACHRLLEREAELSATETSLRRELRELGLDVTPEQLGQLPLPRDESLRELAAERETLRAEQARLREAQQRLDRELADIEEARTRLGGTGEVPSEAALHEARALRERAFGPVEAAARRGEQVAERDLASYAEAVVEADTVADRLWREADRVRQVTDLQARSERCVREGRALLEQVETWESQEAAWNGRLRELLAPSGLAVASIREVERKVERARALQAEAGAWTQRRTSHVREVAQLEEFAAELTAALAACGAEAAPAQGMEALARLGRHLAHAGELVATQRQRTAQAEEIASGKRTADRALTALTGQWEKCRERSAKLAEKLRAEAEALGLQPHASQPEVGATVRLLLELDRDRERARALRARVQGMRRDMAAHQADVRALCEKHLEGPAPESVAEGVDRLQAHHDAERRAAHDRERIARSLAQVGERQARAAAEREAAREELARLCRHAGVTAPEQLAEAERRATLASQLDAQLRELRQELLELGAGQSLEALREAVSQVAPNQAQARRAALESELAEVGEQLDAARQEVARTEAGLELFQRSAGAAELAERLEAQWSEIAELARGYLVHRLAERLLRGEVERYREANQGPVLRRASALLGPLTLGRYTGLKVDFERGETPQLRCLRPDGAEVDVAGLSDGTRDQLYLALRLSSLERFLEHNRPVPLVLDDCFVHFDDERATAALATLGRYTGRCQVLLFTHHARMVDLARDALGARGVEIHDLEAARQLGEGRSDGPLFARG